MSSQKHIFSLYSAQFFKASGIPLPHFFITEPDIVQRITKVIRLKKGDRLILFNQKHHAHYVIETVEKKVISLKLLSFQENKVLEPSITCLLPLLKREAFEEALYFLTALGVTTIQPFFSEKSSVSTLQAKDYERFQRIIIAAAEQSKQFNLPLMKQVLPLKELLKTVHKDMCAIFFDPTGKNYLELLSSQTYSKDFMCMVGPEGDFTNQEKTTLQEIGFTFCKLTPSILRSEQALALGVGVIRCWFNT